MEQFYIQILAFIRKYPVLNHIMIYFTKYTVYIPVIIYPLVLLYTFVSKHNLFLPTLLKPLLAFISLTVFRKLINRKRPYEIYNYEPLLSHKQGQSFPSRHTLSAFIIAFVCIDINYTLGIFMLIIAFIIALSRILAGIHHISDVLAAILYAYIFYII